jgi:flagellin-like protein
MERTEAGSPVNGAILLVAITVILAAIIAVFGFGVAGSVLKTSTVAAAANQVGDDITVTWQGGPDNSEVYSYYVTLHDTLQEPDSVPGFPPIVGNTTVFTGQGTAGKDHVVVTAVFYNGPDLVVLDTYV